MQDNVVDRIYEAAFLPEKWIDALGLIGAETGSASGAIVVWNEAHVPQGFRTTPLTQAALESFMSSCDWQQNERAPALHADLNAGFTRVEAMLTAEMIARDPVQASLRRLGLESQAATIIPMPNGERVCFTFERYEQSGPFDPSTLGQLDALRPHLARAGLMAARLGLERAVSTVATLRAIGLPAAVMTASGRVLTTNDLFDAMATTFLPSSHGGLAINDVAANLLFQEVLAVAQHRTEPAVRSIPVAARDERGAMVVHVLPLRRDAHDLFSGGDLLVVATAVHAAALVPAPAILMGLFDLTPAEVRLATALASGQSVQQAAVSAGITFSSARTYLDRIFRKTGTHQQSQLVALLKSAQPFPVA